MGDSIQDKLDRVRPPRVQLKYKVYTNNAIVLKELPFVVGVMGDFTGYVDPDSPQKPIKERSFINIDRDEFNQRLKACNPRVNCKVENTISFKLTEEDLKELKTNEISDDIIEKLQPMVFSEENKLHFTDKNEFIKKLKEILGETNDDTIDAIMETVQKKFLVDITFNSIDDFRPDNVALKIPELAELLDKRKKLKDLLVKMETKPKLQNWLDKIIGDKEFQEQLNQELQTIK